MNTNSPWEKYKNKRFLLLVTALLLLLTAAAGYLAIRLFFAETEEEKIIRSLHELTEELRVIPGKKEGFVVQMEHAKKASEHFAETCDVVLPRYVVMVMAREHILQNVLTIRKTPESLSITLYDIKVLLDKEHGTGKAMFTGLVQSNMRGDKIREVHEFELSLCKQSDQWLIDRAAFREIIKK